MGEAEACEVAGPCTGSAPPGGRPGAAGRGRDRAGGGVRATESDGSGNSHRAGPGGAREGDLWSDHGHDLGGGHAEAHEDVHENGHEYDLESDLEDDHEDVRQAGGQCGGH